MHMYIAVIMHVAVCHVHTYKCIMYTATCMYMYMTYCYMYMTYCYMPCSHTVSCMYMHIHAYSHTATCMYMIYCMCILFLYIVGNNAASTVWFGRIHLPFESSGCRCISDSLQQWPAHSDILHLPNQPTRYCSITYIIA